MITGFGVAIVLGCGGGFGIRLFAATLAPPQSPVLKVGAPKDLPLTVISARGSARVRNERGQWQQVTSGVRLPRPAGVFAEGLEAQVEVTLAGVRLLATHGSRVMFNSGTPLVIHQESGRLIVNGQGAAVQTMVPMFSLRVEGGSYGISLLDKKVIVSAIGSELELSSGENKQKIGPDQQAVVTTKGVETFPVVESLKVEITSVRSVRGRIEVEGTTAPYALLVARRADRTELVRVDNNGVFRTWLAAEAPAPGELEAFDAAGRRAEAGQPSTRQPQAEGATPPPTAAAAPPEVETAPPPAVQAVSTRARGRAKASLGAQVLGPPSVASPSEIRETEARANGAAALPEAAAKPPKAEKSLLDQQVDENEKAVEKPPVKTKEKDESDVELEWD